MSVSEDRARFYERQPRSGSVAGACAMVVPEHIAGARVLDVLCRSGKGAFKLADRVGNGGFVRACDPRPSFIALAQERLASYTKNNEDALSSRLSFAVACPESLSDAGVQDESIDVVYVNSSLNTVFDLEATLREFARVLVPGGRCWVAGAIVALGESSEASVASAARAGNVFAAARTKHQWARMANACGFSSCAFLHEQPAEPGESESVGIAFDARFCACCIELTK